MSEFDQEMLMAGLNRSQRKFCKLPVSKNLNTATRSKGHEYDACIILDADDIEWPNSLSGNIEEERRLFYVAMTRARKALYFSVSGELLESRFLLEVGLI